jgi:nitroimidazol reductase NimA-like FMN-containing flavoprotein (pyridoxamine 5'-phosphate oxidase superfamily)
MAEFAATARTRPRRFPRRVTYDRDTVHSILDEALVCHLGFEDRGQPFVVPTLHARVGDELYFHGSAASRALRAVAGGLRVCVTVTLVDGIVLARTAFNHSVNYRSVMILGTASAIDESSAKLEALERFAEKVVPGRWDDVRPPTPKELKATSILALPLAEVSAKMRTGPPADEGEDLDWPAWAGVIPLALVPAGPVPDPLLDPSLEIPAYASAFRPPSGG